MSVKSVVADFSTLDRAAQHEALQSMLRIMNLDRVSEDIWFKPAKRFYKFMRKQSALTSRSALQKAYSVYTLIAEKAFSCSPIGDRCTRGSLDIVTVKSSDCPDYFTVLEEDNRTEFFFYRVLKECRLEKMHLCRLVASGTVTLYLSVLFDNIENDDWVNLALYALGLITDEQHHSALAKHYKLSPDLSLKDILNNIVENFDGILDV